MRKPWNRLFLVLAMMIAGPAAWAGVAKVGFDPGRVQWDVQDDFDGAVLTVSLPGGEVVRQEFDAKETPVFELAPDARDGAYTWELRLVPRTDAFPRQVTSGTFLVRAGAIVAPEGREPRVRKITGADQIFNDDLIVKGNECVGADCVLNESFGSDTLRLKANALRIKFEDTSTSAGFASNDWQLTANDSTSGGANKFSIEDITAARVPFTITAGAATNSIFVDGTGRVGLRTATPALDLHVSTGSTPAIRLEQTAGVDPAQTWDIGGDEAEFFVRDVTSGSRLPLRIRPGAPTSSIDVSASGSVGLGTATPSQPLHVVRSNGTAKVLIEENSGTSASRELLELRNLGGVSLALDDENDASRWVTSNIGSQYQINNQAVAGVEVTVTSTGSMTLAGTLTQGSDRTTKTDIEAVDPDAILAKVSALPIATWRKKGEEATHLGPMAQDFSAAFGLGEDERRVAPLDVAGVGLAAIQALHDQVKELTERISALEAELAAAKVTPPRPTLPPGPTPASSDRP
jgi:hypothetical protein